MGAGDNGSQSVFSKAVLMSRFSQQDAQTTDRRRDPIVGPVLCSARQSFCHHLPSMVDKPQMKQGTRGMLGPWHKLFVCSKTLSV